MKKTIILLLCVGISAMLFSGCQGDTAQSLSSFVAEAAESTPEPVKSEPLSSTADTTVFTDVPSTHWACSSIESAFAKGLIKGTGNGLFEPESTLTRAQVAQIAYNAYGGNGLTEEMLNIQDVPGDVWYTEAVTWLLQYNLAELNEGKFHPDDPATRWFIADVLYKLAVEMDVTLPEENSAADFPDMTGEYTKYAEAVTALQKAGIISGFPDGTFGPEQTLTRCQMAKLIDLFTDIPGLAPGTKLPMPEPAPEPTPAPSEPEAPKPTEPSTTEPPATTAPPETEEPEPEPTPEPTPSESTDGFDWVDIATTYDGILRPYAESLGFDCEYRQATDIVNGGTRYYLYFTKGDTRVAVIPKPASNYYSVRVGRPDDSNSTRIEDGVSMKNYATSSEVKDVLKSAS